MPTVAVTPALACPFCRSVHGQSGAPAIDEHRHCFPSRICRDCGTHFLFPPPTDEELNQAYATSYYGEGATKFGTLIEGLRDRSAAGRARALTARTPEAGRVLDVGCGDGRFLRVLGRLRPQFELHGIEMPGPAAARAGEVPGVQLHLGTLADASYPKESFDLISLVHVIEHLPDPQAALMRLTGWLKPGGVLFLAFPNIESWQARWFGAAWFHLDPPRHLSFPPPRSVESCLARVGIRRIDRRDWCPEQNLYGWLQSVLNACDGDRNLLYERLKRNRRYRPHRSIAPWVHLAAAGLLSVPAILTDVAAAIARSGATVELSFQKSPADHVS